MFQRSIFAGITLLLSAVSGIAQTSPYSSMTVAGEFNTWAPNHNNMILVSNNQWEATVFIAQTNTMPFKFTANGGWSASWGLNNFTSAVPMTDTATSGGNNIVITNLTDGFYRFRFNDSTRAFSVEFLGYEYAGPLGDGNLIRNGGFDISDPVNTNEAYSWKWRPTMAYGDRFGSSGRVDWRFRSPESEMFIGSGGGGGVWQDVPAGEDFDYELSGWFWMDGPDNPAYGPWTAVVQEVKFEFYNSARQKIGADISTRIPFVYSDPFKQVTVRAAAPVGARWARAVVNASGTGNKGSLQFDDLSVRAIPRSSQYFTTWTFTNVGTLARGGWVATGASVITNPNLAYVTRSLALRKDGKIRSPYIEGGISRIEFRYRNGNTNDAENADPPTGISFKVSTSTDGITFGALATTNDIQQQSYMLFSQSLAEYGSEQHYFEIEQTGGTNLLFLDNIEVLGLPPTPERGQSFGTWTNASYLTNGCHELDGWRLCTGRVFSTTNAFVAPSALLPGRTVNWTNFIQSPLLEGGYGDLTFVAARGTNGLLPAKVIVQESANASTWTTVAELEPISSTAWTQQRVPLYQPEDRYLRILNVSTGAPGGAGVTLIDEGFDAGVTPPPGWTFKSIAIYETVANSGREIPGLKFDATGDYVETPLLAYPTNLQFKLKGNSINAGSIFRVEAFISGSYTVITNISGMTDQWRTNNLALSTNTTRLKFTYANKAGGNFAFDDVIVQSAPLPSQPAQDLLIDEINIRFPEADVVRFQNFETWPTKSQYNGGVSDHQGWKVDNAIINKDNAPPGGGQVLRLNTTTGNFIVSPPMYGGVGTISFSYAKWLGDNPPTIDVQMSKDGDNWTTLTNLLISNASSNGYQNFEYTLNTNATVQIRLYHSAGSGRAMIDDILIDIPRPPVDLSLFGWHEPVAPFTNDVVTLHATTIPLYGALVTNVTAYYRMGTNGTFTAMTMEPYNFVNYRTTNANFGPFTNGTLVQYYIRADFTGPGAASPRYYPAGGSSAPAFFAIPRAEPGQVWINEIKYDNFFDDLLFFIELAGPTNFDLSRWSIELYRYYWEAENSSEIAVMFDRYVLTNNARLSTSTTNIGFWTLGKDSLTNSPHPFSFNMNFMSSIDWGIDIPLGVILKNDGGGIEYALSFNGAMRGFNHVPTEDDPGDKTIGVSLVGSGTNYGDFVWTNTVLTPGAMNDGQEYGSDTPDVPDAWISRLIWSTNVTIVVAGNTNSWNVTPQYATKLELGEAGWGAVTPFNSTYANGTNTIWFTRPTTNLYFLRVRLQK